MRTISDSQKQALEYLSAEGRLRGLPIQTAEKDLCITAPPKGRGYSHGRHRDYEVLATGTQAYPASGPSKGAVAGTEAQPGCRGKGCLEKVGRSLYNERGPQAVTRGLR